MNGILVPGTSTLKSPRRGHRVCSGASETVLLGRAGALRRPEAVRERFGRSTPRKSEETFALVKGVCHLKAFLAASLAPRSVIAHSVPPIIPERDALSEASEEAAEGLAVQNCQVTTEEPESEWASHSEAW